ncbi:MAG: polyamine aminopropyltransferase [Thermoprotei archaeon]|nr:MAG: polyamine aminopropyltransferase [Thermoprotei archaeon]
MGTGFKDSIIEFQGNKYYIEKLSEGTYTISRIKRTLYRKRSKYQQIEIIEIENCGKALFLDGALQFCTKDEHVYHEIFVHPPMLAHEDPRKVLIVGGGDGGVLREVLKYKCVKKVDLVEIDRDVVEAVKKFMPDIPAGAFNDRRVSVYFEDGLKFIKRTDGKYDVMFIDVTDSIGPSTVFYKAETYSLLKDKIYENGIVVYQALGSLEHKGAQLKIKAGLERKFKHVNLYAVYVPNFCQLWFFAAASDVIDLESIDAETIEKRFEERNINTRFYTPTIHAALVNAELCMKYLAAH